MPSLIDLHVHTTASDGALSPTEVVEAALRARLKAIAVTDHDTVDGLDEALAAGRRLGLEVVPGVEFSVIFDAPGFMHLLGLFIDHRRPVLAGPLKAVSDGREDRNRRILAKLNELGLEVTMAEVLAISGGGQTGRPHIGQALVDRGYAADLDEAMANWLKRGAPAYQNRYKLEAGRAIELIHAGGGLAVLAHPVSLGLQGPILAERLEKLKEMGLDGVEVFCPTQDAAFRLELKGLAERLGLLVTGGSDFHGRYKPRIAIGFGEGDLRVGYELLERLKEAIRPRRTAGRGG